MPSKQSIVLPVMKPEAYALGPFLDQIKSIGVTGVELLKKEDDFDFLIHTILERGLKVVNMIGHTHWSPKEGSQSEAFSRRHNHSRLIDELAESIDLAIKYNVTGLTLLSGHRSPGVSEEESIQICAEGLKQIVPYAEKGGINLNIEVLNSKIDHPGYLCDTSKIAVELCKAVGSPRVKILYDIYHMSIMEGDLIRHIERAAPWIGHFHTAGNPGRSNLDESQEINYPGVCRAIRRTGYDLYLGHEFRPTGDYFHAIQQAYDSCNV